VNAGGANGLLLGNPGPLLIQAKAIGVVAVYSLAVTFLLLKVIDLAVGLRVEEAQEVMGLDLSQHSESGYDMP
jgi:Amt family ammonium transporter